MPFVRSVVEVDEARRLSAQGLPASSIARRLAIPRTTVRDWLRRPDYRPGPRGPRLDVALLPGAQYAYLLGLYLGDGHIVAAARTFRLTIKLDARYRYARYAFANRSDDIKQILCDHLDRLGIRWTRPNEKDIAIARKADVARMDEFVGPKH
jgi:hypothetical protein